MDIAKIYANYETHSQRWLSALNEYSDEQFHRKPSGDEWSVAQVYDHLAQVTAKCVHNAMLRAQSKGETGHG
jgi:uncharacterized damage-inducible protein DinB